MVVKYPGRYSSIWQALRKILKKNIFKMTKKDLKREIAARHKVLASSLRKTQRRRARELKGIQTLLDKTDIYEVMSKETAVTVKSHVRSGRKISSYTRTYHRWHLNQVTFLKQHRDLSVPKLTVRLNRRFLTTFTESAVRSKLRRI